MNLSFFFLSFWCLCGQLILAAPVLSQEYSVRLAVASGQKQIQVQGRQLTILDGDLQDVLVEKSNRRWLLVHSGQGIRLNKLALQPRSVILQAEGAITVAGRKLLGQVEISAKKKGLQITNRMALERYLAGLLGAEMSASWPLAALQAQAVAARTFALRRCLEREGKDYDLETSTLDQVYRGIGLETESTHRAVRSTAGEVITYHGLPAEALFHACCGGRTRSALEVFGNQVDYLQEVSDPDCHACPARSWEIEINRAALAKALGKAKGFRGKIASLRRRADNVIEIVGSDRKIISLPVREFRRRLGAKKIKSTVFTVTRKGQAWLLRGQGYGHGVGMCQWGAKGMADRGESYRAILKKFYPGTEIRRLY